MKTLTKKRTQIDFSTHELKITKYEGMGTIHHLKKQNTMVDSIKFMNVGGVLAVCGDYGNWIFCREFHPAEEGYVSDHYWMEKLRIASTQDGEEFDPEGTRKELERLIKTGYAEQGFEGEQLKDMIEYAEECLGSVDDSEFAYRSTAYDNLPPEADFESIVFYKKTKYWLLAIFDGFEEVCRRVKKETSPDNS